MEFQLTPINDYSNSSETLCNVAFLSYHIAIYKANLDSMGCEDKDISLNEIYDYLQDLKKELNVKIPNIEKRDVAMCFNILRRVGICHCPE